MACNHCVSIVHIALDLLVIVRIFTTVTPHVMLVLPAMLFVIHTIMMHWREYNNISSSLVDSSAITWQSTRIPSPSAC